MQNAIEPEMPGKLAQLQLSFQRGITRSYAYRQNKLLALKALLLQHEQEVYAALLLDLHKSKEEIWATELGVLIAEINHALKHLKQWMQPKKVATNLMNLPSSSYIYAEPLGTVLVIAPWNYPFMLLLGPFVGAIAAGNTVVLKPSEFAPATAALVKKIVQQCFDENEVLVVEGDGAMVIPAMMEATTFAHVFFTGGTAVGKIIYEMAAKKLVPVTLELGGKSPCVVDADANINVAAKRIALTKFSNAGQMCIAPDYLLVHHSIKEKMVLALQNKILAFFSDQPQQSENFGRIINGKQFQRIVSYLNNGRVIAGGKTDEGEKYIAPTLMDEIQLDSAIMQEEIFGPILPVISFSTREEALAIIARHPNPLSFYIYTGHAANAEYWLNAVQFGGGCVNNSSWHFTNIHLPFGGRGKSGTGAAHGKASFDCFTHYKAVMKTPTWFDPAIKYPPFEGKLSLFKKLIR
jgi:aldehyde dehydrogenase (NAD+)